MLMDMAVVMGGSGGLGWVVGVILSNTVWPSERGTIYHWWLGY